MVISGSARSVPTPAPLPVVLADDPNAEQAAIEAVLLSFSGGATVSKEQLIRALVFAGLTHERTRAVCGFDTATVDAALQRLLFGDHTRLVCWVNSHDIGARENTVVAVDGDELIVEGTLVGPDGAVLWERQRIQATIEAARNWLGY